MTLPLWQFLLLALVFLLSNVCAYALGRRDGYNEAASIMSQMAANAVIATFSAFGISKVESQVENE